MLGVRPISASIRAYSSAVMLCIFSSAGVISTGVGTGFAVAAATTISGEDPARMAIARYQDCRMSHPPPPPHRAPHDHRRPAQRGPSVIVGTLTSDRPANPRSQTPTPVVLAQ